MPRVNRSKRLYGLFIFICVICLFPVFALAAEGATLADLAGTWDGNALVTGPDSPRWDRISLTVATDGTFTLSGTESNGNVDSGSGAFSISSDGIVLTLPSSDSDITAPLCQINSYNTVLVCTETWSDGSTNLIVLTKEADSYTMADLAGNWEGNFLISGPTFGWIQEGVTVNSDGTYRDTTTGSDGSSNSGNGTLSISSTGVTTCVSGDCLNSTNYSGVVDAGKTVMVATSGASTDTEDAVLYVFAKKAASYSRADLAGTWGGNSLASGTGAPWWERGTATIGPNGTFTVSATQSDGSPDSVKGTFSISSDGVITISGVEDSQVSGVMDSSKTLIVISDSWDGNSDPATTDMKVFTKSASAPGAPTGVTAIPGNAQATVSFTPPASNGDSAITGYTVTSIPGGKTAKGNVIPLTVKGLKNGTHYTFTVTATNAIGTGPASSPSAPAVIPATVPGAPTIVAITAGNQSAKFTFKPPSSDGGSAITGYTVTWTPTGGSETITVPTSTTRTVTGLNNGTTYTFTLTASNVMGTGPPSRGIKVTPATVPNAPTIGTVTAGRKQATVNFTPLPASEDGGDPVTSYIVTAYINGTAGKTASGPHSPITVTGLT
ncbi:MAG: fibronectin type III domain-containing protein [Syntrophobacteraceae bacterium]